MLTLLGTRARVLAAAVVALVATGCGVPLQDEPVVLRVSPAPSPTSPDGAGTRLVDVYMISEGHLVPQLRTAEDRSASSAVELLAEGLIESERESGMTTAVAPGKYVIEEVPGPTFVIDVPLQFTQVEGDLQLLAAAQLVWTVTDLRPEGEVVVAFDGEALELPTDRGLTSDPVRRQDYASVAPQDG